MLYTGLDVHSKWTVIEGFDPETGETVRTEKVPNDRESLERAVSQLKGPLYGAMESGTNAWAVYRTIRPYFEQLFVVDPLTVWGKEGRRGAKTDKRDAFRLTVKMQRGELQPLYVPDEETQDLRVLTRAKINASRHVTKLVNELGSVLRSWGIVLECSLLSAEGQRFLASCRKSLPKYSLTVLDSWLRMIKEARQTEDNLERLVEAESSRDESCGILKSIPGVGSLTALVVRAEIGDINRFATPEKLVSYCGLSPSVNSSADKTYYGRLSKFCNKYLKYVLILRAQSIRNSKQENPLRDTYWRVFMRNKANPAKIAVARQLARVMYRMLVNKEYWDPTKITQRRSAAAAAAAAARTS